MVSTLSNHSINVIALIFSGKEGFTDLFIRKEMINNRTGAWFVGVMSLSESVDLSTIQDGSPCSTVGLAKDWFQDEFYTADYEFQVSQFDIWKSCSVSSLVYLCKRPIPEEPTLSIPRRRSGSLWASP